MRSAIMNSVKLSVWVMTLGVSISAMGASPTSTINTNNKWAWASNAGWIDCRTDPTNGAVIGEYVCSGYFYSGSLGWIHLGNGNPTNGIRYCNAATNDYGVNHDGKGNLRGYAWSGSVGWIAFENTGAPKVDLCTGILSGYAWGGSMGWINFSNEQAFSQSDTITGGSDNDNDDIPDVWELDHTGYTNVIGGTNDYDRDGVIDANEYVAGTNPTNENDFLRITAVSVNNSTNAVLTWASQETRLYTIERITSLTSITGWQEIEPNRLSPNSGTNTTKTVSGDATQRFYRVKAIRPLLQ